MQGGTHARTRTATYQAARRVYALHKASGMILTGQSPPIKVQYIHQHFDPVTQDMTGRRSYERHNSKVKYSIVQYSTVLMRQDTEPVGTHTWKNT